MIEGFHGVKDNIFFTRKKNHLHKGKFHLISKNLLMKKNEFSCLNPFEEKTSRWNEVSLT